MRLCCRGSMLARLLTASPSPVPSRNGLPRLGRSASLLRPASSNLFEAAVQPQRRSRAHIVAIVAVSHHQRRGSCEGLAAVIDMRGPGEWRAYGNAEVRLAVAKTGCLSRFPSRLQSLPTLPQVAKSRQFEKDGGADLACAVVAKVQFHGFEA
ncbi:hypothetical protein THAOC_09018 [Thalassiosira oceanica]|uniref:Uncharacterized protein n=1 Tax=Thalassiosira oceanica TaxID=159749 RepID=K0STM8_THAOC|nr:hypothetical protein THAOC_09018 [Thalassiosira oceanica]|eukprot:EJK69698.1 hypothetical protein THAOC_09018 [Thalassiosira oceanica]